MARKQCQIMLTTVSILLSLLSYSSLAQDSMSEARREAVQDYQAQAVRLYPELGRPGSPLNKAFLKGYDDARKANDPIIQQLNWPLVIAKYAAESVDQTKVGSNGATDAGILPWLRKVREDSAKQAEAAQVAQEKEVRKQQEQADLERSSVVLRGTVSQIVADGIIMDARFLDGYDSEGGPNAPRISRNLDGSINPEQSGFTPRYRTEKLFLSGHPQKDNLIDGEEVAVVAVPNGAYHATTVLGATKTIRSWKVLKTIDVGQ